MTRRLFTWGAVAATLLLAACSPSDDTSGASSPTGPAAAETTPLATLAPVATAAPTTAAPVTTATPSTTPAPEATAATTTLPPTTTTSLPPSPLNGLGVADASLLERRVVAVKIDNHPAARPQSGIQEADAVYELLVEGGLSRFIALFHAADSAYVGPIRSIRPTDGTLVKPLGAIIQISGGQQWVRSLVSRLGVEYLGNARGGPTFRVDSRSSPHNLYGDTVGMRERADRVGHPDEPPPAPLFVFGTPTASEARADSITLSWSGGNDVRWDYDGTRYMRYQDDEPHAWVDADGNDEQIAVDTLVVLAADRYTASPRPGESGPSVPALDTVGEGRALVFYAGLVVEGTWSRDDIAEPFSLYTASGDTLVVPPGKLWVSVFPSDQPVSWQ